MKWLGDGALALFDGPARAIRCGRELVEDARRLGIEIRVGLHAGECEVRDDDLGGLAVHIAARVVGHAGPNEVVVSSTVKDLVAGSGIGFTDRGTHALKGVPGEWRLFAVQSAEPWAEQNLRGAATGVSAARHIPLGARRPVDSASPAVC